MIKVGIDLGNSKISCVVCDIKNNFKPKILSFVSLPTININKSNFINYESIRNEIKELIDFSAKESQTEIKSINLNIPLLKSKSNYYSSVIFTKNEIINDLHIKKAINESDFFSDLIDQEILMNYVLNYEIDDTIIFGSPIGNFAKKLKLNFYKLSVNKNLFNTYKNIFKELNIHVEHYVPTPLSSSLAVLNKDDKDLGCICIDLGESSTSVSIFENNKLIFCDSVSVGSKNITNDIARGISTTKESAERLKTLYGSVQSSPSDEYEIIEVPSSNFEDNNFKQINRSTINSIIKPRVEETLELIWQLLKQNGLNNKKIKNVVLTGGGSQLEGIKEYAQIIFDSNVRTGKPLDLFGLNKSFSGPQFSQTIGAVFYQESQYVLKFLKNKQKISKNNVFGRFSSWLDQYI